MKNNNLPVLALAPMAGITDLPFRLICKKLGADIVYSEMISATGLFYNSQKTFDLMKTVPEESPMILQLFGNKPEHFQKAVKIISSLPEKSTGGKPARPQGIDINFGCPQKKIIKQGSGCALMKDFKKSREIIEASIEASNLPISIKIRAGIKEKTAIKFLEEIGDLNWKALMIHGRTFEEGFAGPVNIELMKKIKEMFPDKKIFVNGGIISPEVAKDIFEKTGADGIGIARGALGDPWIFKQIKEFFATGEYSSPSKKETTDIVLEHINLFKKYKKTANPAELKKHLFWYIKNFEGAQKTRQEIMDAKTLKDMKEIIQENG
ncbi:MAG: tRNA-dihydrouridine synthase [Patescibacteria group bacterium]|nr:tRNA-dihydrouridine synthase [Patescibacteria group bacterium]